MKIFIQNMVSLRCKMMVKSEMEKLGIAYAIVELGEVNLIRKLSARKRVLLQKALHLSGLELMDDAKAMLIERIKNIVVEMIHYDEEFPNINVSTFLSQKLNMEYHKLSSIFSRTKGITIEQYIILHKIKRVNELLIYDEFNLTQIAFDMHYSSVAHLSNQFKKVTGLTPSEFKTMQVPRRQQLEDI